MDKGKCQRHLDLQLTTFLRPASLTSLNGKISEFDNVKGYIKDEIGSFQKEENLKRKNHFLRNILVQLLLLEEKLSLQLKIRC
jgi:hypothetical protein